MLRHLMLTCAGALLCAGISAAGPAFAEASAGEQAKPAAKPTAKPADPPAQAAPAAKAKFVPPIRGLAEIQVTRPNTKRAGKEIVTIMKVKNVSTTGSIAGLKLDEFWYDKAGTVVTGDTYRHQKPLMPGEVIEITLRTPSDPRMNTNSYNFSHANGKISAKPVPKL
jgi:hypothetical protein